MYAKQDRPPHLFVLPTSIGAYRELSAVERATTIRKAKWMVRFERENVFCCGSYAGPGHFAERNGATAELGRMELDLGHALKHFAWLEAEVLSGTISAASGAVLGRIFAAGLERPGDDWLGEAKRLSTRQLHRVFVERRDERAAGEAVYAVLSHLTPAAMSDLSRCRVLVSRSMKQAASNGQTIGVLAREYRRRHDPLLKEPGKRRTPDTCEVPGRHVPAEVDRAVRARTADGCRFPLCDHEIWVDRAHHKPHSHGGSREASNLHLLCKRHHRQFDEGRFLIRGTPEEPLFFTPDGRPIDGRTPYLPGDDPLAAAREAEAVKALLDKTSEANSPPDDPEPPTSPKSGRARSSPPDRDHGPPPASPSPPHPDEGPDDDEEIPFHRTIDWR